jgi:hypothetical protein
VENLQRMLLPYSAEEPIFFGFRMNPILKQGYMSENAGEKHFMVQKIKPSLNNFIVTGIVMSHGALKGLVQNAFEGKLKECPPWTETKNPDDIQLGI